MQLNFVEVENLPQVDDIWVNKKTGNKYLIISANVINATNADDGQKMVLYKKVGKWFEGQPETFVREYEEFILKFEKEKS